LAIAQIYKKTSQTLVRLSTTSPDDLIALNIIKHLNQASALRKESKVSKDKICINKNLIKDKVPDFEKTH